MERLSKKEGYVTLWKRVETKEELEIAFEIRNLVFVQEQGVPVEAELDQYERESDHVLVYFEQKPVGTGRLRVVEEYAKFERICVLADYRQYGLGKKIVHALETIALQKGLHKVKLHGQTQATAFYHKLGYETASDIFMEDGIPHVLMTKTLSLD